MQVVKDCCPVYEDACGHDEAEEFAGVIYGPHGGRPGPWDVYFIENTYVHPGPEFVERTTYCCRGSDEDSDYLSGDLRDLTHEVHGRDNTPVSAEFYLFRLCMLELYFHLKETHKEF